MKKVAFPGVDSPSLGATPPSFLKIFFDEGADAGASPVEPADTAEPAEGGAEGKDDSKAFSIRLSQERTKLEDQYSPYKSAIERQAQLAGLSVDDYLTTSQQQADEAALKAEAEEAGKTVEELKLSKEKSDAEKQLEVYQRRDALAEEEKTLMADEKIGSFVKDNLEQIRKIAEETGTDLQVGLALVVAEKLPELLAAADPQKQIEDYLEGRRGGTVDPVSVGKPDVPGGKPLTTFSDALSSARERLKKGS
jgi:hypothetical protein